MDPIEQQKIAEVGESMWFFRALHRNLIYVLRRFSTDPNGLILDAGSGAGGFSKRLASFFSDAKIIALDINPEAAKISQKNANSAAIVGSVNQLPISAEKLSVIVSVDVIYHEAVLPNEFATEAHRCLTCNGILVVNVPAYQWLFSAHDRNVSGVRRYTRKSLSGLLESAGFEIVYSTYWNMLLFPFLVIWRKLLTRESDKSDLRHFPKVLEILFNTIMKLEYCLLCIGLVLPFGGSVIVVARRK